MGRGKALLGSRGLASNPAVLPPNGVTLVAAQNKQQNSSCCLEALSRACLYIFPVLCTALPGKWWQVSGQMREPMWVLVIGRAGCKPHASLGSRARTLHIPAACTLLPSLVA